MYYVHVRTYAHKCIDTYVPTYTNSYILNTYICRYALTTHICTYT